MIKTAKGITDAEIEQAAAYFSELKPRAVIKVVETATVPKSRVAGWFLAALPGGETEPIAGRIIEVPEDLERFEMRDARSLNSPADILRVPKNELYRLNLSEGGDAGAGPPSGTVQSPEINRGVCACRHSGAGPSAGRHDGLGQQRQDDQRQCDRDRPADAGSDLCEGHQLQSIGGRQYREPVPPWPL